MNSVRPEPVEGWTELKCRCNDRKPVIKFAFALHVMALVVIFNAAPAWATDECDRLPLPSVAVKRLDEPVSLDTTYG